jgi:CheY-like chemotaxis protein
VAWQEAPDRDTPMSNDEQGPSSNAAVGLVRSEGSPHGAGPLESVVVNREETVSRATEATTSGVRGVLEGLRVVIVDDDSDARDLLATVLVQRSAKVFVAESAAEALELVRRELPDALISDIAMPEEDGYMLIGRVRALPEEQGGKTTSIALTAYAGRADRKRALDAGFDTHFSKPLDIDKLVLALAMLRPGCDGGTGNPPPAP